MDIECSSVSQICKRQAYNTYFYSFKIKSKRSRKIKKLKVSQGKENGKVIYNEDNDGYHSVILYSKEFQSLH